jgi:hypothetical protein
MTGTFPDGVPPVTFAGRDRAGAPGTSTPNRRDPADSAARIHRERPRPKTAVAQADAPAGPAVLAGQPTTARVLFACHRYPFVRHSGLGVNAAHSARAIESWGVPAAAIILDKLDDLDGVLARAHGVQAVLVQALWYTADELAALAARWPRIRFVVRLHSQWAFLPIDDRAPRLFELADSVGLSGNNPRFVDSFRAAFGRECSYLPNLYPLGEVAPRDAKNGDALDVGLFGAARLQKHHTSGAMAAAIVGRRLNRPVRLHINTRRNEGAGWQLVHAIALAAGMEVVEHPWCDWEEFTAVARGMDVGFQLSSTETFNYVTADLASHSVPSVVGEAIEWAPADCIARIDDPMHAAEVALRLLADPTAGPRWRAALEAHQAAARATWLDWLRAGGIRPRVAGGPGTELHKLFGQVERVVAPLRAVLHHVAPLLAASLDLRAGEGCGCTTRALQMDAWGPDGCETHLETIVGWLVAAAAEREVSLPRSLARMAIRTAIRRARSKADAG